MILGMLAIGLFATSCSNDDDAVLPPITPDAKEITGGPFTFVAGDGIPDMVSGIATSASAVGTNKTFVITDDSGNILGLPPTLEALEGVDFDGAGVGTCLIWYLRYENGLQGAEMGMNANDLQGSFDLSNSITVNRNPEPDAKMITGGPFTFVVDGTADMVSGVASDPTAVGTNSTWVVTDDMGNILGLPPTLADLEGVNFDGAGIGTCLIWYLRYEDNLTGATMGANASGLGGDFSLSNSITVTRVAQPEGGTLTGGDFTFCVDGTADMVSGVALAGNVGTNSTYVITDASGTILGLPPTLTAVEGVDFDGAGAGTCLIWHLSYEDDLMGAAMGMSANNLTGTFDLSNAITVVRNEPNGGGISGGPFNFTVDGTADMVSGITLDGTQTGTNSTWVITDAAGNILGLPPTLADVEGVNFDGAGVGTCLIWYLRYEDGLQGAVMGMNANDLSGCFSLSNSISVVRN